MVPLLTVSAGLTVTAILPLCTERFNTVMPQNVTVHDKRLHDIERLLRAAEQRDARGVNRHSRPPYRPVNRAIGAADLQQRHVHPCMRMSAGETQIGGDCAFEKRAV